MRNYSYIIQENKNLFFKDLQHAYTVLEPKEICKDTLITSGMPNSSADFIESITIDSVRRGCLQDCHEDLTRLLMHPFFRLPQCSDNVISLSTLYNSTFSDHDTVAPGYIIEEFLCDAALLTSFDVIYQILLSKHVRISVFLQYFCKAGNDHYTFATQFHKLCKQKLPKPSSDSSDNVNESELYPRLKSDLDKYITNLQNKARNHKALLKENPFLQQLLFITNNSSKAKKNTDNSHKSLSMNLPLSQYLLLIRLLSKDIQHLQHILKIYADNSAEGNSRKNIQFSRRDISAEMIRYKFGYLSLGNRAFDRVLLSGTPTALKITPEREVPFFDELLIYQKMESVFHCELTEMMAKKYADMCQEYTFLKRNDLLDVSFFGIFNNLPNYLTRSIFVNYAFLILEQICNIEKKDKRSQYIELWKNNCISFVSELTDIVFPKILWHILIDLFRMSNLNFDFSHPKIEPANLAWVLQALDAYIYTHRVSILKPLDRCAEPYKSLSLSDTYEKKAPLRYFKKIIQATDFSRSQQLLPPLP